MDSPIEHDPICNELPPQLTSASPTAAGSTDHALCVAATFGDAGDTPQSPVSRAKGMLDVGEEEESSRAIRIVRQCVMSRCEVLFLGRLMDAQLC
jgi:hypothetical protein